MEYITAYAYTHTDTRTQTRPGQHLLFGLPADEEKEKTIEKKRVPIINEIGKEEEEKKVWMQLGAELGICEGHTHTHSRTEKERVRVCHRVAHT